MVHLEDHSKPRMMLLDIVEVGQSHTGVVLGNTFVEVLKAFGIENKVSFSSIQKKEMIITHPHLYCRSSASPRTMRPIMT
jgi:hypothetical protein